jgi:hypothetical protein
MLTLSNGLTFRLYFRLRSQKYRTYLIYNDREVGRVPHVPYVIDGLVICSLSGEIKE